MPVLIVSAAFARLAWPGEPAIGKRLQVAAQDRGPGAEPIFRTIVGVAADMRYRALEAPTPTIYAPFAGVITARNTDIGALIGKIGR